MREDATKADTIGVCLSGGGVRAMLFGLGALRAVSAGLGERRQLMDIASVSGGSIGAAFALSRLPALTFSEYDEQVLKPAVRTVTRRSLMWGSWKVWAVLALFMLLSGVAAGLAVGGSRAGVAVPVVVGATWLLAAVTYFKRRREVLYAGALAIGAGLAAWPFVGLELHGAVRVAGTLLTLAAILFVLSRRGDAIEHGIERALFPERRALTDLRDGPLLVLTATELGSGEAVYLTRTGIRSWRWGTAEPGELPLVRAVRASATFPVVFPALRLPHRAFSKRTQAASDGNAASDSRAPRRLALVDGGVYDNMGTEWFLHQEDRRARRNQRDMLIVVNASQNLAPKTGGFWLPGWVEGEVLLREQAIQYDVATAPRRRWLLERFKAGNPHGTIVSIGKNIIDWAEPFVGPRAAGAPASADERAARATRALSELKKYSTGRIFDEWPQRNSAAGTTLDVIAAPLAASLVRAGYLATAVQLYVLEGWPEPECYDPAALMPWLDDT